MPFLNKSLALNTVHGTDTDNRIFTLLEPLRYFYPVNGKTYEALKGTISDGISDPAWAQPLLARDGKYLWEGINHDAAYHFCLVEIYTDDAGVEHKRIAGLTKNEMDLMLRYALIESGCPTIEADTIYEAVHAFGMSALEGDASLPIP